MEQRGHAINVNMQTFISGLILLTQLSFNLSFKNTDKKNVAQDAYFFTQLEGVNTSNFELVGGLILVEAELNGKKEKFIFDTGSPYFLLNNKTTKKRKTSLQMNGVGGNKKAFIKRKVKLNWNGIDIGKRRTCYEVDLDDISRAKNIDFAGLIGYDQVKNHEVIVDYENKRLHLIKKKHKKRFFRNHKKVEKIKLHMVGHIPVVKVKIGKKNFYFGIDTGAEMNVINISRKKYFPKKMITTGSTKMIGNNVFTTLGQEKLRTVKIGKTTYQDVPFVYADLDFLTDSRGRKIDGLLGYPFLKNGIFSIDFRKKKLNKWELKNKIEIKDALDFSPMVAKLTTPLFHYK